MVAPGSETVVTFQVLNASGVVVQARDVRQSCGCSPAAIDWTEIRPGETKNVQAVYRAAQTAGEVSHAVYLSSDAADTPELTLRFLARVGHVLEASPAVVELGQLLPGALVEREIKLLATDGLPFVVSGVTAPAGLSVTPLPGAASDVCHRFTVAVTAPARPGFTTRAVSFATSHPSRPRFDVPVRGVVASVYRCTPPVLMLSGRPGAGLSAVFTVSGTVSRLPVAVSVTDAGWSVSGFKGEERGGGLRLTVDLACPPRTGLLTSRLRVTWADGESDLEVPLNCYIAE